jgi:Ran GTPase-activating protein (RanGAP) involved in mRNA processing and transport
LRAAQIVKHQLFSRIVLLNNRALQNISFDSLCLIGASAIVDALCQTPRRGCKEIYLSFMHMKEDNGRKKVFQMQLARKCVTLLQYEHIILKKFNFAHSKLGDEFVAILANGLKTKTQLTSLDLSGNNMSKTGAENLANALYYNRTLGCLDLTHNAIADKGATAITRALHYHPTLRELHLWSSKDISSKARQLLS